MCREEERVAAAAAKKQAAKRKKRARAKGNAQLAQVGAALQQPFQSDSPHKAEGLDLAPVSAVPQSSRHPERPTGIEHQIAPNSAPTEEPPPMQDATSLPKLKTQSSTEGTTSTHATQAPAIGRSANDVILVQPRNESCPSQMPRTIVYSNHPAVAARPCSSAGLGKQAAQQNTSMEPASHAAVVATAGSGMVPINIRADLITCHLFA